MTAFHFSKWSDREYYKANIVSETNEIWHFQRGSEVRGWYIWLIGVADVNGWCVWLVYIYG